VCVCVCLLGLHAQRDETNREPRHNIVVRAKLQVAGKREEISADMEHILLQATTLGQLLGRLAEVVLDLAGKNLAAQRAGQVPRRAAQTGANVQHPALEQRRKAKKTRWMM
jgi:hypothetical protein